VRGTGSGRTAAQVRGARLAAPGIGGGVGKREGGGQGAAPRQAAAARGRGARGAGELTGGGRCGVRTGADARGQGSGRPAPPAPQPSQGARADTQWRLQSRWVIVAAALCLQAHRPGGMHSSGTLSCLAVDAQTDVSQLFCMKATKAGRATRRPYISAGRSHVVSPVACFRRSFVQRTA